MIELLAIPAWNTEGTLLDTWVQRLAEESGAEVTVVKDPPQGVWLELPGLRIRGYAMMAGPHVEAINFELFDPDPATGIAVLEQAAATIAWEIHPDDDEDGEDEEENDDD